MSKESALIDDLMSKYADLPADKQAELDAFVEDGDPGALGSVLEKISAARLLVGTDRCGRGRHLRRRVRRCRNRGGWLGNGLGPRVGDVTGSGLGASQGSRSRTREFGLQSPRSRIT